MTRKLKLGTGRDWLARLVRSAFAKWPRRRVRPVCRFLMTEDMRKNPRCINAVLRQRGYTSGDRIVVMLESDFSRVAELAHTKIKNPLHAIVLAQIYAADMERISSANDQALSRLGRQWDGLNGNGSHYK